VTGERGDREEWALTRYATETLVVVIGAIFLGWAAVADDLWFQFHLMPYYCVTKAGALGRAHVLRGMAIVLGSVLVLFVRPRFGRIAARHSPRAGAFFYVKIVAAVVLAVVVTDVILRIKQARAAPPPVATIDAAQRPKKETTIETDGHAIRYAFNAEGFRTRTPEELVDHHAPTILFSGESVMMGYGVEYDATIPVRVGKNLGVQVANLAVSATANDQIYYRLKEYLPRFEHPIAVVTTVVYNILFRDAVDWRYRLVLDDQGKLVLIPPDSGIVYTSPLYRTFRDIYHSSAAPALVRAILKETDAIVRAAGAKPLFLFTQCGWERCLPTTSTGPWLRDHLREGLSLDAVDVEFDPKLVQAGDVHPNAQGLEPFVTALTDALRKRGVGTP
jgi:hypothetical protein